MKKQVRLINLALAALAALAPSCGGSTPVAPPPGSPVALDDFAAEAAAAQCEFLVRCHLVSDVDICRASLDTQYADPKFDTVASAIASVHADKAAYDPVLARACVDRIRGIECTRATPNLLYECAGVFSGKLADGDRCIASAACAGGSSCLHQPDDPFMPTCNGICTPLPAGPCLADTDCASGEACNPPRPDLVPREWQTATGSCGLIVAPGGIDQPCGSHASCQHGLHCASRASAAGVYVCEAPAHLGEQCLGENGSCDEGLICIGNADNTDNLCAKPAGLGEACDVPRQCGGQQLSSMACDLTTHVCVALPTSGPCLGGSNIYGCDPRNSYCDASQTTPTCVPLVGRGEPCSQGSTFACGRFTNLACFGTGTAMPTCGVNPALPDCTP